MKHVATMTIKTLAGSMKEEPVFVNDSHAKNITKEDVLQTIKYTKRYKNVTITNVRML